MAQASSSRLRRLLGNVPLEARSLKLPWCEVAQTREKDNCEELHRLQRMAEHVIAVENQIYGALKQLPLTLLPLSPESFLPLRKPVNNLDRKNCIMILHGIL